MSGDDLCQTKDFSCASDDCDDSAFDDESPWDLDTDNPNPNGMPLTGYPPRPVDPSDFRAVVVDVGEF